MRRALLAALVMVSVSPAAAVGAASDPLLSGYGGPGDGEQALLGQTLIRGAGGGRAAPGATAPTADAIYQSGGPAASPTTASSPGRRTEAGTRSARRTRGTRAARPERPAPGADHGDRHAAPATAPQGAASPLTPAAPVSTDTAGADAPLSGRDLLLIVAIGLALVALAAAARRLAVQAADRRRPPSLQR